MQKTSSCFIWCWEKNPNDSWLCNNLKSDISPYMHTPPLVLFHREGEHLNQQQLIIGGPHSPCPITLLPSCLIPLWDWQRTSTAAVNGKTSLLFLCEDLLSDPIMRERTPTNDIWWWEDLTHLFWCEDLLLPHPPALGGWNVCVTEEVHHARHGQGSCRVHRHQSGSRFPTQHKCKVEFICCSRGYHNAFKPPSDWQIHLANQCPRTNTPYTGGRVVQVLL